MALKRVQKPKRVRLKRAKKRVILIRGAVSVPNHLLRTPEIVKLWRLDAMVRKARRLNSPNRNRRELAYEQHSIDCGFFVGGGEKRRVYYLSKEARRRATAHVRALELGISSKPRLKNPLPRRRENRTAFPKSMAVKPHTKRRPGMP